MLRQPRSASSIPFGQSAVGPTSPSDHQKEIPAEFRCFLCNSLFEDPLLLSCSHSFCRRCVEPWLRQSTNCPHCRFTTLAPIRNTSLIEKIADYKRRNGKQSAAGGNFIRSFVRRTMRPSKEARTLQREAVRASQRRPKNVVLPEKNPNSPSVKEMAASLEGKLRLGQNGGNKGGNEEAKGNNTFPRMGNLRRSFARIRRKMSGKSIPEEPEISPPEIRSNSSVSNIYLDNSNSHLHHSTLTIGELLARNQQQNFGMPNGQFRQHGLIGAVGFTEINLHSPANASYHSMASGPGPRRPSMGVSGTALRQNPATPKRGESQKVNGKNGKFGGQKNYGGNNGNGNAGCAMM